MERIISNFDSLSLEIMSKYAGMWIAVVESKVIAHGDSIKEVYEKAKKNYPDKKPLLGKVPIASTVIYSI